MSNSKKVTKEQRENMALNRALLWFGGAIVLEVLLLLINRYYVHYRVGESNELDIALAMSRLFPLVCGVLVAAVAGVTVWLTRRLQRGQSALLPGALMLGFGIASLCSFAITLFYEAGVKLSLLAVPVVGALGMVYYLYQKEFFVVCLSSAAGIVSLWAIRTFSAGLKLYLLVAVLVAVILACVALTAVLLRQQGVLTVLGQRVRVFSKGASPVPMYLSAALSLAATLAGLLLGAAAAYYAIFVLVAMLFILAVYYTVKLM